MAKFKPGQSGNPAGRKKGSKNRTTEEIRQALLSILDNHLTQISADLKKMNPKDRANWLIALAKHLTPPALNPEMLTESMLEQLIEHIQRKKNEQGKTKTEA
jgi:hypothetical protein